jgi:MoxR-like ATPase
MSKNINDTELLEELVTAKKNFSKEIGKVIIGQRKVLNQMLIALLTRGHTLLVGVPGLAKTLLIKSMADICDLNFKRIQFTPDLMPSDITGTELIDIDPETEKRNFRFYKGPIFGNIILADEINRTPPKTQSALLEAMQEHKVTAGGNTYELDEPFFVFATQNPIEQEGTYPLPEAQLDRFMFHLNISYPTIEEEISIVNRTTIDRQNIIGKVFSKESIINFQNLTLRVPISENVVKYAVKLVSSTRPDEADSDSYIKQWVEWGAGPRASQYLALGAKAKALLDGRPTPSIEDVQSIAPDILRHRVLPNFNSEAEGIKVDDIVNHLIKNIEA